jgi:hypothetical protein
MKDNIFPFSGKGLVKETNRTMYGLRVQRGIKSGSSQDRRRFRRLLARLSVREKVRYLPIQAVVPRCTVPPVVAVVDEGPKGPCPREGAKEKTRRAPKKGRVALPNRPLPPTRKGRMRELRKLRKWYPGALRRLGHQLEMRELAGKPFVAFSARIDLFPDS